jgi:hypothetical protein
MVLINARFPARSASAAPVRRCSISVLDLADVVLGIELETNF